MVQEQHTSLRNCTWNLPSSGTLSQGTLSQGAACTFISPVIIMGRQALVSVLCGWAVVSCRHCVTCISEILFKPGFNRL